MRRRHINDKVLVESPQKIRLKGGIQAVAIPKIGSFRAFDISCCFLIAFAVHMGWL